MDYKEFYARCAQILGVDHDFHEPPGQVYHLRHDGTYRNVHKTRWNDREPGNGRFPGRGLVQHYGRMVHVCLRDPLLTGYYTDPEKALAAIAQAMGVPVPEPTEAPADDDDLNRKYLVPAELQPHQVPNDIMVMGRFFRLKLSDKASIANGMGIHIPATQVSDFERFKAVFVEIKQQNRLRELWSNILAFDPPEA